jgi:hypothetical protein
MRKDTLRRKLQRVEALSSLDDAGALRMGLQSALHDDSNVIVAKAAVVAANRYVTDIVPDLLAAYDRLFVNGPQVDRSALGKQAIVQALKDLDYRDPAPFSRGLQYYERTWGFDSAAGLRATCAHALVACDIDGLKRYELLIDHLVDPERTVRREVVRAIAQVGSSESVLLLRLKAVTGDADAEVIGECFVALLDLEPRESVTFVRRFLASADQGLTGEAASALAGSRVSEALRVVHEFWRVEISTELRRTIIFSSAASPRAEASEFLLSIVGDRSRELSVWAVCALASSRFRNEVKDRLRLLAERTGDTKVVEAYVREFESA